MSAGDCLCDQEFDLTKPCMICRMESGEFESGSGGAAVAPEPKDEEWLPYIVSDLAEKPGRNLSDATYGEIMDLANMLHDLGIGDTKELQKMLGVHFDGEHWRFGHKYHPEEAQRYEYPEGAMAALELPAKPPIQLTDRRKAVLATRRKNNVSE
jgi:hypothetical protein